MLEREVSMDVSSASSFASKHRSEMPDGEIGRCRRIETLFRVLESKKGDIRCTEEKGKRACRDPAWRHVASARLQVSV